MGVSIPRMYPRSGYFLVKYDFVTVCLENIGKKMEMIGSLSTLTTFQSLGELWIGNGELDSTVKFG